ncbi:AGAP006439-PA-like protein [Anopheles sinensis]|uniref:AGAP006439-PA-like protein n=1 Tax=Anopheles sinensis TaxID=74873 RepID=A0A084VAW4_ANOSI|nr:AGAP006439-PA-like protein [Anopheles sinensis]
MRCIRKKMSLVYTASYRYRRALQTMAAGLFLIYMALVLYQAVYGYGSDGTDQDRPAGVAAAGGNLQVSDNGTLSNTSCAKVHREELDPGKWNTYYR